MSETVDAPVSAPAPESDESMSRRVLSSTVWNYAGHATTLLVWFLLTPFVVSQLGAQGYGLFVVAMAFTEYCRLLELGLSSAVTRYVAELRERRDFEQLRSMVATGFAIAVGLVGIALLVGLLIAPFAPDLMKVPEMQRESTYHLVIVAAAGAGMTFPTAVMFAVLQGLQRFDVVNVLQIAATLIIAGGTIAALLAGLGVEWVVGMTIPASLIVLIPTPFVIRRVDPELGLGSGRPSWRRARDLFSFSWAVMVMQGAGLLKTRTDEIVIAALMPVANVTPYSLARRVSEAPVMLTYQFGRVIMPLAAQVGARDERGRLQAIFLTGTRVTLAAYATCAVPLFVLGGAFLAAWVGEEFRDAGTVVAILAAAAGVEMIMWTAQSVLQGISRHRPLAAFVILGAGLNLGLSIALIGPFGVEGVAFATLIAAAVEAILLTMPYSLWVLRVGAGRLITSVAVPVFVPVVPALLVARLLSSAMDPDNLIAIVAIGAVVAATYLGGYLTFPATSPERRTLLSSLGAVRSRLRVRFASS